MYIVVTDKQIYKEDSLQKLDKKHGLKFTDQDFTTIGEDCIVTLSADNYEYVKDLKKMAAIPIELLFKPENSSKILLYVILVINFIILVKG